MNEQFTLTRPAIGLYLSTPEEEWLGEGSLPFEATQTWKLPHPVKLYPNPSHLPKAWLGEVPIKPKFQGVVAELQETAASHC